MRENRDVSAHNIRVDVSGGASTLLGLLLEGTRAGSGVDDFLADLASLAAAELSHPGSEVSCGITVHRRKQVSLDAGSTSEGSVSTLRIPIVLDDDSSAVVNFYSPRTEAFSNDDVEHAQQFAVEASRALLLALRFSQLSDSRDDLAAAMQSRTIIDIAIGAIMAQNRCGREAAFKILRNTSNNRNMKIRDVAAAVVASIAGDTDMTARFEE
ncbi:ANTAR domain-containing protein [Arthrobacter sp. AL12]|uniref:ANTAR domain-containing protein n=1 Tax=Arthrobacter sp. AL12 TaxID=3042241 RepID=UPI00249A08BE|nr:ANTAR domain-containing protein [Arthrobacter sp. AL12]MDI3211368.1 ANTAR domain-containing protein [Arthrobacter sp. AL12]